MELTAYLQNTDGATLDGIKSLIESVTPKEAMFCFAYATVSGCAEFQRKLGDAFWQQVQTRWLLGIDHGRTEPTALEFIRERPNTSVRVFDGYRVAQSNRFRPETEFHMKSCFVANRDSTAFGMLCGSGNFSLSGLVKNIECGLMVTTGSQTQYNKFMRSPHQAAQSLWELSVDVQEILETYKSRWATERISFGSEQTEQEPSLYSCFWIEAGYVTRNRGPIRPGNQIDLPRGVHAFFGLAAHENQERNSTIGQVTFVLGSVRLTCALRLGNNYMEKVTLPFPEDYGIGAYDGKVLEFTRTNAGFTLHATELEEFVADLNRSQKGIVKQMGSGRLYGFR